ncbi:AhpA/YtjB family protein [Aeromonas cavernicola]|uniref:SerB-cotransposed membrane protein n=1 Tax=Aeromonas cavernicola TaxID=1006623 RepID=A0A2H9U2Q7_9GAMM|nr:AhpA/YtjB family protein [Aeromonas cavernicola]PJG58248.1 hypothetical protein CUC53_13590 [Aeromonas cavernicola]
MRHLPIKRALSLGAGILLGLWVVSMLIYMQSEGQSALRSEARLRAEALVSYASRDLARWLKEDNQSELARLAQDLASDPNIFDVTIYDERGVPLAQSEQGVPLESLLPIGSDNRTVPALGKGRSPFVQEILDGPQTLGYLRITLEEQQLLAAKQARLNALQEKQRLLLLVALLAGLFISYGVRRNYLRVRKHQPQSKSQSL